MTGIKALRRLQLGVEAVSGTAVAATALWRGLGTMEDTREVVFVEEDVGFLSGLDRTYTPRLGAALTMDDTEATYEQLPYVLAAGVENVITGGADGAGSGKIYLYSFPTTAPKTTRTYTIEGGDNHQAYRMEYGFVRSFSLAGVAGEAWKISVDWLGRQMAKNAFTAAPATPVVEEALFSRTKLYIDAVGGTIGTTLKSNTLLGATLNVDTGLREVETADGNIFFAFTKQVGPEITLDITLEHDASAITEYDAWVAETPRQIRLLTDGTLLTTAGTNYSRKTLKIDLAGKWEKFEKLGERDGNDILAGTFRARFNATAALYANIVVVNQLASLP